MLEPAIFLFILFSLQSSQVAIITGLAMTQTRAQQESGKTPAHESRDYNFSLLRVFHLSMSYLENCQATTVNGRSSNQNSTTVSTSYMDITLLVHFKDHYLMLHMH